MTTLNLILIFSLLGGVLSVLAASLFLVLPEALRHRILPHMISFAVGSLLGAAFLGLLPHALMSPYVTDYHHVTLAVLIGLLSFFLMEKLVLWRHCHAHDCEAHGVEEGELEPHDHQPPAKPSAAWMILFGDGLHNFVDGVLIAAAFMTDIHLGIVTSLAVAAHEIPQEVGDFVVLLQGGFSRAKALTFNILASLTTVIGAVVAYYSLQAVEHWLPYILAVAASSFIYIAVADLIPSLHQRMELRSGLKQVVLIVAGVVMIYLAHSTLH